MTYLQDLFRPMRRLAKPFVRNVFNVAQAESLLGVNKVEISEGEIAYLLLMLYIHGETRFGRKIVRGWKSKHHTAIYDKVLNDMTKLGLCIKPLGGGTIKTNTEKKEIEIFGRCSTFGKADHATTAGILNSWSKYKDYKIQVK